MSICEETLKILTRDFKKISVAYSDRIINSNLPHGDYIVAKTTYNSYNDAALITENALSFTRKNTDDKLPDTFIPSSDGTPDPEETKTESTVHAVDIESGTVSEGSN